MQKSRPMGSKGKVIRLALALALSMTGTGVVVTVSALAGRMLAPDPKLATLPIALMFTMTMFSAIPASLWMKRIGRRKGFIRGQLIGIVAACLAFWGIYCKDFALFVAGSALIGIHNAFYQYYRFAAAEVADEGFRSRAISWVLAGGVAAAFFGPELAKASHLLVPGAQFGGAYLVAALLGASAIVTLWGVELSPLKKDESAQKGRPIRLIVLNSDFLVAVISAMVGYGAMVLLMTATPLAMKDHAHSFDDTALVIQWHVLGMYAPSFFTGNLIARFGVLNVLRLGAVMVAASAGVNLTGTELGQFWLGLLLLGVGWNFMFVGGTTLLTETYRPAEAAKVQAANDFLVFGLVAAASFSSGALQAAIGWRAVNWAVMPFLILTILYLFSPGRSESGPKRESVG